MKRALFALVALLMLVTISAFSQSAVPQTMNFQGRLAKPDGTPLPDTNSQTLTFTVYSAATGGTSLWSQTSNVAVHNGAFTVPLNFAAGYPNGATLSSVFGNALFPPYLEMQVGSNAPLTPRRPFASVAYAFHSGTAENALAVANGSVTLGSLASGVLTFSNLSGSLSLSQIPDGLLTGDKIANNTLSAGKLSPDLQAIFGKLTTAPGPNTLTSLATIGTGNNPLTVAISGNYAYVVNEHSNTLQVFDVSNPVNPILKGSAITDSLPVYVTVKGSYAYVTNFGSNTLQVFSLSDPINPNLQGSIGTGTNPYTVALNGKYAYVVNYVGNSLQIFDVSNPTSPTLKGSVGTGAGPYSVVVSGNYAYVVNVYGNTLQVFDVGNPDNPTIKSSTAIGSNSESIAINGNYAYVVNYAGNSLQIFDVSNPTSPTLRGSVGTGSSPVSVAVQGNAVYVTNADSNTLQVFDVSNPATPVLTGSIGTGNQPYFAAIQGNVVYVVNEHSNTLQTFSTTGSAYLKVLGDVSVTGKVGIGTTTPAYTLDVVGDINTSGSVRANGIALSSDARFKTHIATLNNALDDVLNLRGVSYDFDREKWPAKHFPEGQQIGFIAQELETVFPQLVQTDANGYKSVMYQNVVPVLVEAVKTQQKQLDAQRREIDELKKQNTRIAELEKTLATLLAAQKEERNKR